VLKNALGVEDSFTIVSVSNVVWVLASQKRFDESLYMYQRAYEGYQKAIGKEHPETLRG
jgi:hypothetical protein